MTRAWLAMLTATLLAAGCSNEAERNTIFNVVGAAALDFVRPQEDIPDARVVLTPELIASSPTSALLAVSLQRDVGYTLIPQAVNRDTVQWIDAAGGGLIRRDGILVGTRGLGFDLFTADLGALSQALRSGGARDVRRIERILDGENQVQAFAYICDVVPVGRETLDIYGRIDQTSRFEERCQGDDSSFTNQFWLRDDGLIVRSIERVSVEYGALELTLIAQ